MSIEQLDKIDFISTTQEDKVQLTISDHLDWKDEEDHLLLLQNKLNAYFDFIENGQIEEDYQHFTYKGIIIAVAMKFPPTESANVVLTDFKNFIETNGFEFVWFTI